MPSKTKQPDPVPYALEHFDRLPDSARVSITIGARVTGLSKPTLYRRIADGKLPLHKDGGRSHLVVGELRKFMLSTT